MKHFYSILLFLSLFGKAQQMVWIDTLSFGKTVCKGICNDSTGNIYLTGRLWNGNIAGVHLTKFNSSGSVVWLDTTQNSYLAQTGGVSVYGNELFSIERYGVSTNIGGAVYPQGMYLIKRNLSGQVQWAVQQNYDSPFDIKADNTGNVYVCAVISGSASVKKYSNSGVLLNTIYDSGYIAVDGSDNLFVLSQALTKYSSGGNILWSYPGMGPNSKLTTDNLGNCYVFQSGYNMTSSLLKFSPAGSLILNITIPFDGGYGVYSDLNNIYVVGLFGANQISNGIEIRAYDSGGNNLSAYQLSNSDLRPTCLIKKGSEIYICANSVYDYECYLIKIQEANIPTTIKKNETVNIATVFPNPSSSTFLVTVKSASQHTFFLKVFDALGKTVIVKAIEGFGSGLNETIDLSGCAKGIYFLEVSGKNYKETRKLVVE